METEDILSQYEHALNQSNKENTDLRNVIAASNFNNQDDPNIIVWQVSTEEILEKIEHFLRGDIPYTDEGGNTYYKKQINKDLKLLNEFGVGFIMQTIAVYVSKEAMLSYLDSERINEMCADIGDELRIYLASNYDKMGLDTPFKKNQFRIMVVKLLHLIFLCLNHSLYGKHLEAINTNRNVIQSDNISTNMTNPMMLPQKKKKGFFSRLFG